MEEQHSFLKVAIELAVAGFHVFPLYPNSKLPAIDDFPARATRDPDQIRKWWLDPVMGIEQPYNVGISTTRFGDEGFGLLVVDVDNKDGRQGSVELSKLEESGFEAPPTYVQGTPTGGCHIVYVVNEPVKQGVDVFARGIDVRSRGGYIVGRGSIIDGVEYTSNRGLLTFAPEWMIEKCGASTSTLPSNIKTPPPGVDPERALNRGRNYLESLEPAEEGTRNHQGFAVAAKLKDFGLDPISTVDLMSTDWKCNPPLDSKELEHVVQSAFRYGREPAGALAPEVQFTEIDDDSPPPPTLETSEEETKSYLEKMNDEYALVYEGGNHSIIHETVDEKGRRKVVFLSEQTFKRKLSPYTIQAPKGKRALTHAEVWLNWKKRREYAGVCFSPGRAPGHNYYNLWTGFVVEPLAPEEATENQRLGLEMFLEHARENVCQGKEDLYVWLMGYFAHLIQRPYERPLTTLVFRGEKGTGKNALVDRVGNLLGRTHYLVAHDGRYLTSNFNGHLAACLLLVLDEAFWSGDKAAEGKLKGITTAPEILIERKGKEPYTVDNLVRLVVIGNEDWLVPASADERRYAVFDIGKGRKQDRNFFEQLRVLLEVEGGSRVLLHHFLNFDLGRVDVNAAPMTEGLLEQKEESLNPIEQWLYQCLHDGRIVGADFLTEWPVEVPKEIIREACKKYAHSRNIRKWEPDDRSFGRRIKKCIPSVVTNQKKKTPEGYANIYRFPPLTEARLEWEGFIGHPVKWD